MLELHSEKLKLIHEKNNKEFLEKSKLSNVTKDKESFFKETRAYYKVSKDFGLKILKDFPNSNIRPEVLFAMALNSRDYGLDHITEKYLLESISLVSDPHHSLRHHAETALADCYYNDKRYQDAVNYYERVVRKVQDEWLSKHYLNVSWCYLKIKEFDKAIVAIRKSYFLSKNKPDEYILLYHCKSGQDRTGTFYAINQMVNQITTEKIKEITKLFS
jgi:tetratricopeptide (TPR) repeat protein